MNHLFLQGDRDAGKSTIIKEAILPYIKEVGGFYTVKLYKNKYKMGFAIQDIQKEEDYVLQKDISSINDVDQIQGTFMHKQSGKWCFKTDNFSANATQYLIRASNKKLIIMDEVGGLELKDTEFVKQLKLRLNGDIPILGVIKSKKNLINMQGQTGYDIDMFSLSEYLEENNKIEILNVTLDNRDEIKDKVRRFVEKLMT